MENVWLTTREAIMPPSKRDFELIVSKQHKTEKLRTFIIQFSDDRHMQLNDMMRKFDLWHDRNWYEEANISTYCDLTLEEYRLLLAYSFSETGGKLFHVMEIIK